MFNVNDIITVRSDRGTFTGQVTWIGTGGGVCLESKLFHIGFYMSKIIAFVDGKYEIETDALDIVPMVPQTVCSFLDTIAASKFLHTWQKFALVAESELTKNFADEATEYLKWKMEK